MNGPNARMNFDDVLDACLDRITGGRATVDECLEAYPEHRAELEPVLRAAIEMTALPRVPERPVDPARRARFMAELRSTPQQDARRIRLPSVRSLFPAGLLGRATMTLAPAAVIAALAFVLVLGRGATPALASTLTVFAGGVERQVDGAWVPVEDGSALMEGDRIRTTADGHALITFADGSTAGLEPNTDLAILEVSLDGPRSITLEQFSGRLWNDVADDDRAGASYVVRTPDAVIVVQGTIFESVIEDGETTVSTAEGLVTLTTDSRRIDVQPGEIVRARRTSTAAGQRVALSTERLEDHRAVEVTIDGPFTAALIAPDGAATGARPDGVVFNQISGVFTSNPGYGSQVIAMQRPEPGEYTLVLQRIGPGGGEIVISSDGNLRRISLDGAGDAVRLKVRLGEDGGRPSITVLHERPEPVDRETPEVRVTVSSRTRDRAASVAEQRARLAAAAGPAALTTLAERTRALQARVIDELASDDPRTVADRVTRVIDELGLQQDLRRRLLGAIENGHADEVRRGLLGAIEAREPEVTRALLRRVATHIEDGLTVSSALLTPATAATPLPLRPAPSPTLAPSSTLAPSPAEPPQTPLPALRELLAIEDAREFRAALPHALGRFDLPEDLALHVQRSLTFENLRELRFRIAEVAQTRDATAAELSRRLRVTLEAFLERATGGTEPAPTPDGTRLSDSDGATTLDAEPTRTSDSTTLTDTDGTTTTTTTTDAEPSSEPAPTSDGTTSGGTDDSTTDTSTATTEPAGEPTPESKDDADAVDSPSLSPTN